MSEDTPPYGRDPLPGGIQPPAAAGVTALSHLAIATRDADALVATLAPLGAALEAEEELLDDGTLRVVFVPLGPVMLELLEPRSPAHTVARFLETRGPGLHHVSFEVADLAAALARCKAAGIRLIDETPRPGAHGSRVAFLHPKSTDGVLIELCQAKAARKA